MDVDTALQPVPPVAKAGVSPLALEVSIVHGDRICWSMTAAGKLDLNAAAKDRGCLMHHS